MKGLQRQSSKSPSRRRWLPGVQGLSHLDLERDTNVGALGIDRLFFRHLNFQCGVILLPVDLSLVAEDLNLENLAGLLRTGEAECLHHCLFLRPALDKGKNS